MKLLVVEDDEKIASFIIMGLRQAGFAVDHAVKYTPDGGRVDVETGQSPKQVIIRVKDTGSGIPEEEIPKIWNRLYRGDKSRSQRGLGLGLSLVMSIVKAHGGYVEVSSQPGTGSTFTVCLPQGS